MPRWRIRTAADLVLDAAPKLIDGPEDQDRSSERYRPYPEAVEVQQDAKACVEDAAGKARTRPGTGVAILPRPDQEPGQD
jgi:hypothetical protein